jgi:hypothetical protein
VVTGIGFRFRKSLSNIKVKGIQTYVLVYHVSEIHKCEKCGKVIAKPKELIRFVKQSEEDKMKETEVGAWGEDYASGELELRGWIVSIPTRDVGIDRVAFKVDVQKFKYLFIQVKTAVWTDTSGYSITVRKTKAYEDPHFIFIFVLKDLENRVKFLVLTTEEWREIMGKKLKSRSWTEKGIYLFHIPSELKKWKKHLNAFDKLETL